MSDRWIKLIRESNLKSYTHSFLLEIDTQSVLQISTIDQLKKFIANFKMLEERGVTDPIGLLLQIDQKHIGKDYKGV